jgi:hypothetical protein
VCSRRDFLKSTLWGLSALVLPLRKVQGAPATDPPAGFPASLNSWVGRRLTYLTDCWLLPEFAEGVLTFQGVRNENRFLATLETRLQGVVGLLSLQRQDLFVSCMEWSTAARRFLPVWYVEQVSRKGKWRRKVLIFHHEQHRYDEHKIHADRTRRRRAAFARDFIDDPLSAFFNWRIGAFGPLAPGQAFRIDDLARKDPLVLKVQMASEGKNRQLLAQDPDPGDKAYYLQADLEQELFHLLQGNVEVWLNDEWVPVAGKAAKVKLLGSLTAHLVKMDRHPVPVRPSLPSPPLQRQVWKIS